MKRRVAASVLLMMSNQRRRMAENLVKEESSSGKSTAFFLSCFGQRLYDHRFVALAHQQAKLKGWKSMYFAQENHLECFQVKLLTPCAGGVAAPGGGTLYNADETTNPSAFHWSACRYHIYRDFEGQRFPIKMSWQLRRHSIGSSCWGEYWATEAQWKEVLGGEEREFVISGKPWISPDGNIVLFCERHLFSPSNLLRLPRKDIVSLIYSRLAQKYNVVVTRRLELNKIDRKNNCGESKFWFSRTTAENVLGVKIESGEKKELYNSNDTSNSSLFQSSLFRPINIIDKRGAFIHPGDQLFLQFASKIFHYRFHLESPYWWTEQEWYSCGVLYSVSEAAGALDLDFELNGIALRNSCVTADPTFALYVASTFRRAEALWARALGVEAIRTARVECQTKKRCPLCAVSFSALKVTAKISLRHVLGMCRSALSRFQWRHDNVLRVLFDGLRSHPAGRLTEVSCDLCGVPRCRTYWKYTGLLPDLCFKLDGKPIVVELSVAFSCYSAKDAHIEKRKKYLSKIRSPEGQECALFCIEVGCFGEIYPSTFQLDQFFDGIEHARATRNAMSCEAIAATCVIFQHRNSATFCGGVDAVRLDDEHMAQF